MGYKTKSMMAIERDDLRFIVHPNVLPQYCALLKLPLSFELSSHAAVLLLSDLPFSDGVLDVGGAVRTDVPFGLRVRLRAINSDHSSSLGGMPSSSSSFSQFSALLENNLAKEFAPNLVNEKRTLPSSCSDSEPLPKKQKEAPAIPNLFRGDSRVPTEVFSKGFENHGDKDRIIEHVEGMLSYSGSRESAFISMSKSKEFTVRWLSDGRNGGFTYYVYEIRPTNNFYDLDATLSLGFETTGRETFNDARQSFAHQQEVVAFGGIAKEQILKAYEYQTTGKGSPPYLIGTIENPNYQHEESASFSEPYPYTYQDDFYDPESDSSYDSED